MPGVISHQAAARLHGFDLLPDDGQRHVTVPRNYSGEIVGSVTHRADLEPGDHAANVTTPLRTILDLARTLPPGQALVVADSALRTGKLRHADLRRAGLAAAGPGAPLVRELARRADGRSASSIESLARHHLLDAGLEVVPQVRIDASEHRFDLGVAGAHVLVEVHGYEFHRRPEEVDRDCRNQSIAAANGYLVLTFSGHQVRRQARWLTAMVRDAVLLDSRCQRGLALVAAKEARRNPLSVVGPPSSSAATLSEPDPPEAGRARG